MEILDVLVYLPCAYLLRMTLLLLHLASSACGYVYNYWFHTSDNAALRQDISAWVTFIFVHTFLSFVYGAHILLQLIVALPQLLPGFTALAWWPRFYWSLLWKPTGRSLWEIITNPRFRGSVAPGRAQIARHTRRHFIAKGKVKIQPTNAKHYLHSSYQVQGTDAHLGQHGNEELADI